MSSILQELESQISGLKTTTTKSNVGIVREIGDGVARIEGLSDVMLNELIEFPGGVSGIAFNVDEDEIGDVLLGDYWQLHAGDEVERRGHVMDVPVGERLRRAKEGKAGEGKAGGVAVSGVWG